MLTTERRDAAVKHIVAVVLVCLAALTCGAAGAYFTGQSQVPDSLVRAGAVSVSTEPTCAALSIDALAPGTVVTKPLTVLNDGGLASSIVVTAAKKAGITDFWEALTCKVTADGAPLYDGPLSGLRTAPLPLNPGARAQLLFGIGLPATSGNDLAGDYAKFTLYFDAEQTH